MNKLFAMSSKGWNKALCFDIEMFLPPVSAMPSKIITLLPASQYYLLKSSGLTINSPFALASRGQK